jgi:hypothetical protein
MGNPAGVDSIELAHTGLQTGPAQKCTIGVASIRTSILEKRQGVFVKLLPYGHYHHQMGPTPLSSAGGEGWGEEAPACVPTESASQSSAPWPLPSGRGQHSAMHAGSIKQLTRGVRGSALAVPQRDKGGASGMLWDSQQDWTLLDCRPTFISCRHSTLFRR